MALHPEREIADSRPRLVRRGLAYLPAALAALALLFVVARSGYLLFHVLAELVSVVVGTTVFVIAWNTRRIIGNNYLLFLGIASLFIAGFDLLHAVAYKGMNVFSPAGADLPTQLWLAGRYLVAASFVLAPFCLGRLSVKPGSIIAGFGAAAALLLASIFWWDLFPVAYVEGQGLTPFKKASEYAVIAALSAALALLYRRRAAFDAEVFRYLVLSLAMHVAAGLMFTVYTGVYDLSNMAGHLFKLCAYYFLYRAVVVTGISKPATILFRDALQREEQLRRSHAELSALYELSTTVSRTTEFPKLCADIVDTVTGLDILHIEPRGALFIAEGGKLRLVFERGHREPFCADSRTLDYGVCLCGLAAVRGEIIVSRNSRTDHRHTLAIDGPPHGHLVLPLTAPDRIVGVLCLYRRPDLEMDDSTKDLLADLGRQLGMAIQNARMYEEAKEHALHDPLTGLANRRLMNILMDRNIARSRRFGTPFTVVMIDIDHFKRFNDSHGHASGDALLVGLGRLIADATRDTDLAVRFGGEEFLVLMPEVDPGGACELAERIRKKTEEELGITVSAGIASYRRGMTKDDLINHADISLYEAKRAGRNRTHCDTPVP